MEGIIIKGYSGFYYVQAAGKIWECSLRGKFRLGKQSFLTGDRVRIAVIKEGKGVIEEVLPRKNELMRPLVANVDQVVIIFALRNLDPDLTLLDRLLILAEATGISPLICFTKGDLATPEEREGVTALYRSIGYPVTVSSKVTGEGIHSIKEQLRDKVSVLAGPSGAGKSTLLNLIQPGLSLKTGEVSAKIGRGRHTTRHVELLRLEEGGLVADAPGFSSLYLPPMAREELGDYFPEIAQLAPGCRFTSCLHHHEPQCAVKEALEAGQIDQGRYRHYIEFLSEVIDKERRY